MAVIGQSHLKWRSRVADHISHGNTIVRIGPIEVGPGFSLGLLSTWPDTNSARDSTRPRINSVRT